MIQRIATRDGYGKRLSELDDNRIIVLTADLAESSRVKAFAEKHPDRFIQVGISEQDMFGMADGLGLSGKIPFTNTFAAFTLRAHEQIRLLAINKSNVKIIGHHAGINLGADGVSQMCEEDISLFRTMPNFTVIVPCDALEAQKSVDALMKINGPCYLRLSREPVPLITHEYTDFVVGKANIMKDGDDVLIVACGNMISESLKAAKILNDQKINAAVMNMHTIKPLDKEQLLKYATKTKAVVTVEEHSIYGGLGSAVCEALSLSKIPIKNLGIRDVFGESGTAEELFEKFGLNADNIVEYCHDVMKFKDRLDKTDHIALKIREVNDIITEINGKTKEIQAPNVEFKDVNMIATENNTNSNTNNNNGNNSYADKKDPRGRIIKMSEKDKAHVDSVLNKMFGGRRK